MTAESWVSTLWQGGHGLIGSVTRAALLPTELIFRAGVSARTALWNGGVLTPRRAPVPVIGVGNLSVGGTGKTPFSSWAIRTLLQADAAPALIARGYGADELELHRQWTPNAPVVADPDRVAAAARAAELGADVIVLDDGFQHRRLFRDLDIVLLAAEQGSRARMLPRGPFREPFSALARAGVVVVTRKSADMSVAEEVVRAARRHAPRAIVAGVAFQPTGFTPLMAPNAGKEGETDSETGSSMHSQADSQTGSQAGSGTASETGPRTGSQKGSQAGSTSVPARAKILTAVARPDEVVHSARSLGVEIVGLSAFPDHHDFTDADLARSLRGWDGPVIVTAKDAVKLRGLSAAADADIRVLQQTMVWDSGEEAVRDAILAAAAGAVTQ